MNHDESFEAEVRATLEGMAREPAPDRLVSRVAAIPSQEPVAVASGARCRPPFLNVDLGARRDRRRPGDRRRGRGPAVGRGPGRRVRRRPRRCCRPPRRRSRRSCPRPCPRTSSLCRRPSPHRDDPGGRRGQGPDRLPAAVRDVRLGRRWLGPRQRALRDRSLPGHRPDPRRRQDVDEHPGAGHDDRYDGPVRPERPGHRRPALRRHSRWLGLRARPVGHPRRRCHLEAHRPVPGRRRRRPGKRTRDRARGRL